MKIKITFSIFIITTLVSCNKIQPAGFWSNYNKKSLEKHINNQGPWGGHRALHWISDNHDTFQTKNVIDFASKNGWTLVDSSMYSSSEINNWKYLGKEIFPLGYLGFNPKTIPSTNTYEYFPRWTKSEIIVFQFKTEWSLIQPGTNKTNDINGFVVIDKNKKEMSVYHLWGE